jgi:hypothetical protein
VALKGTIRDFGVADIFQLIGQQAKTGALVMSNDVDEVRVYFREGAVIRAENITRPEQMLFGNLMVRAGVLTPEQLDRALQEQQKNLKRLGAVLIDLRYADAATIREFATLQTTETIYRLFEWEDGQYEFEPSNVDSSPEGVGPISAETIVMNGVRMVDEWPGLREQIPSYSWEVHRIADLLPPPSGTSDLDFATSFGDDTGDVGPNERIVFNLTEQRRNVQQIIDRSRLGEFEACQALGNLINDGYVRLQPPSDRDASLGPPPMTLAQRAVRGLGILARVAVSAGLVLLIAALLQQFDAVPQSVVRPRALQVHFSKAQLASLRRAIEVYRLTSGTYPESLGQLVEAGLVEPRATRFPFEQPYHYARTDGGYRLLPPLR